MASAPTSQTLALDQQGFAPRWLRDAVVYQIFPDRFFNGDRGNDPGGVVPWGSPPTTRNFFGGDLFGIVDRLDYLTSLGVSAILLNPIFEAPSNHKYDTRDYLTVDRHLGTERDLQRLLHECHRRDIRVVLDGVFNHTGVGFFAFADVRKHGEKSPYRDWYTIHSFPIAPPTRPNYECWWGLGELPKLRTDNPDVRQYLFKVTCHWLERGIDGWRLDVPNEISHDFWIEWRRLVKSVNPDALIVGEIWDEASPWLQGDQFDSVLNYRFRDACLDFFARGAVTASEFEAELARQRADYPPEVGLGLLNMLGSHDTERILTASKGDPSRVRLAQLLQFTYPGVPHIYYGDEVGLRGGDDPECRGTMPWNDGTRDTDTLRHVRSLVALRRRVGALRRGSFVTCHVDDAGVLAFARTYEHQTALVVVNAGAGPVNVRFRVPEVSGGASWRPVWPEEQEAVAPEEGSIRLSVPPRSGTVLLGEAAGEGGT